MSETRQLAMAEAYRRGILSPEQTMAMVQYYKRNPPNNARVASIIEPLLAIGSSAIAEPVSGFVGLAGLPFGGDVAANSVTRAQEALTYKPKTESGQAAMQRLGGFMQGIADKVNPIAAGTVASLYDAIPFAKGDATEIYNQLPKQGLSGDIGSLVADKTGSPELATLASLYPTAMLELMGLKGAGKVPGKQYEFSGVGGQSFGQRGAVTNISEKKLFDDYNNYLSSRREKLKEAREEIRNIEKSDEYQSLLENLTEKLGSKGDALLEIEYGRALPRYKSAIAEAEQLRKALPYDKWLSDKGVSQDIGDVYYHGTSGEWDEFDMGRAGSISSGAGTEEGMWLTRTPRYAAEYAQNSSAKTGMEPNVMKFKVVGNNPLKVEFNDGVPVVDGVQRPDMSDNLDVIKYAKERGYDSVDWVDGSFTDEPSITLFNPSIAQRVQ